MYTAHLAYSRHIHINIAITASCHYIPTLCHEISMCRVWTHHVSLHVLVHGHCTCCTPGEPHWDRCNHSCPEGGSKAWLKFQTSHKCKNTNYIIFAFILKFESPFYRCLQARAALHDDCSQLPCHYNLHKHSIQTALPTLSQHRATCITHNSHTFPKFNHEDMPSTRPVICKTQERRRENKLWFEHWDWKQSAANTQTGWSYRYRGLWWICRRTGQCYNAIAYTRCKACTVSTFLHHTHGTMESQVSWERTKRCHTVHKTSNVHHSWRPALLRPWSLACGARFYKLHQNRHRPQNALSETGQTIRHRCAHPEFMQDWVV